MQRFCLSVLFFTENVCAFMHTQIKHDFIESFNHLKNTTV